MKKIFTLIIATIVSLAAVAQVSTTPQNKKVVLEEYTGQTCQYCPDGHKIAADLKKNNPGKVFLVNIHSGGYATPSATYPMDLRTTEGNALDAASGLTGYPAGSVNRFDNPWAQGRNTWTSKAATQLGNPSPVNVYVKSNYDRKTGLLTTDVEVYYTANGTGTFNKLSVMLTQDSIEGDQISGATYNPTNFKNGKYLHNHVLRKMLNNYIFGDTISPISATTLKKFKFVNRLPLTIGNVPLNFDQLHVVAFVHETSSKILNGDETKVTYDNTIPGISINHFDAGTTVDMCSESITPKLSIQNNSTTNITSFDLAVNINGVETTQTVTQALNAGATINVTLPAIPFVSVGNNNIKITGIYNINNGANFYDSDDFMDLFNINFLALKPNNVTGDVTYGFETTSPTPDLSNSPAFTAVSKASFGTGGPLVDIGANNSTAALLVPLHSSRNNNKPNNLLIGRATVPNAANVKLSYSYAYSDGVESGTAPYVKVYYSDDCGVTFKKLDSITCVQTGQPANATSYYFPKSSEYLTRDIDITSLKGKSNIIFKITALPTSTGNALYLDEINLKSSGAVTPSADTFISKVFNVTTASVTSVDVVGTVTMTAGQSYTWKINTVSMPVGWSFKTICDAVDCVNYPAVQRNTFTANSDPSKNNYKLTIDHAKKAGYGFVTLKAWKGTDSVAGSKDYKFALLTSAGSSIGLVTDASEKMLYYFDNKIFVDREFAKGTLQVFDINGKQVMNSDINSDNVDFVPSSNGIYIARISIDGQVVKSLKFSTDK